MDYFSLQLVLGKSTSTDNRWWKESAPVILLCKKRIAAIEFAQLRLASFFIIILSAVIQQSIFVERVHQDCNRFHQLKHWPRKSIVILALPPGVSWSTLYNGVDDISIMYPLSLSATIHIFGQYVCWAGARKLESASAAVTTIDSNSAIAIDVAHNLSKIHFVIMWVL